MSLDDDSKPANSAPVENGQSKGDEKALMEESGGSLSVVRSMVAVCLIERVPFIPIDSSTVLRKLENDSSSTLVEKEALRELGGDSGSIVAVEMALRSIAEDNGGVELEEFVVSGKSRITVMKIDRTKLLKELPETKQLNDESNRSGYGKKSGESTGFGVGRGMQDAWMMVGPRGGGGGPRGMGMMGVPRGVGVPPPMHRHPQMGGFQGGGTNSLSSKPRTEEDDLKDVEALLNKKSFKELQKSKTGEELLDLIHRPTAKETAVAAKVCDFVTAAGLYMIMFFALLSSYYAYLLAYDNQICCLSCI